MAQLSLHSPLGELTLSEEDGFLVSLDWGRAPKEFQQETPLLIALRDALHAYFDGKNPDFDFPLHPQGTAYQQAVWQKMLAIPYGETRSYGELAKSLCSSPRAVGNACGANPIPIIIPCHRVVSQTGPGGYSGDGGTETKLWLLRLEEASLSWLKIKNKEL